MRAGTAAIQTEHDLLRRNPIFERFFTREAPRLARACLDMSRRFLDGGRLLAFGNCAATTDAQHVSVEFVHPVIMGKRALPALDLGLDFASRLAIVVRPEDIAMGFAFPYHDLAVARALRTARGRGALTFALAGQEADYSFTLPDEDPFICQEVFELLYHLLWETVHVYFEHREQGHDVGASAFLYPFLGTGEQNLESVVEEVQHSMLQKMEEINAIRSATAVQQAETILKVAAAIRTRISQGGKLIAFGNGGSATDANDLVIDCVAPPAVPAQSGPRGRARASIPAISLSAEPANITAIANDVGTDVIFTRQLIAHAQPEDVAIGISTSGSSPNILNALIEAGRRGLLTVAIAGYDGGTVVSEGLADYTLVVHSDYIPRIQEVQASVYHVLLDRINDLRDGSQEQMPSSASMPPI